MRSIGTNDGLVWWENLTPEITDEENAVIDNPHAPEAQLAEVMRAINSRNKGPASPEDIEKARVYLNEHLPAGALITSFSVLIPDGCGVLNFHGQQIRF
jgi:hypothetical protein